MIEQYWKRAFVYYCQISPIGEDCPFGGIQINQVPDCEWCLKKHPRKRQELQEMKSKKKSNEKKRMMVDG